MRLIDADLFMQRIESYNTLDEKDKALYNFALHEIVCMPTVDVLDKIRAEIDGIEINGQVDEHTMFIRSGKQVKQMALDVVNKYK